MSQRIMMLRKKRRVQKKVCDKTRNKISRLQRMPTE